MEQKKRKTDFSLPTLDELFSSQEERDNEKVGKFQIIPISEIDDFPDHPYKVRDNEDMYLLSESIKSRGVITPAIVRQKEDGRYELIAGHRRKRACQMAGIDTLKCEVMDLNDDEATILMVETNFQRTDVLPSEKAFAYKRHLEAMKRQGYRSDLTSAQLGRKLNGKESADIIGQKSGDGHTQVRRYIRLTNLVPELLEFVDEGKMKLTPAVEISYLDEDSQRDLVDAIDDTQAFPSHGQARKMRKFFEEGKISAAVIESIMEEEKGNQKERYSFTKDDLNSLLPKNLPSEKTREYILAALKHYLAYNKRREERDSR